MYNPCATKFAFMFFDIGNSFLHVKHCRASPPVVRLALIAMQLLEFMWSTKLDPLKWSNKLFFNVYNSLQRKQTRRKALGGTHGHTKLLPGDEVGLVRNGFIASSSVLSFFAFVVSLMRCSASLLKPDRRSSAASAAADDELNGSADVDDACSFRLEDEAAVVVLDDEVLDDDVFVFDDEGFEDETLIFDDTLGVEALDFDVNDALDEDWFDDDAVTGVDWDGMTEVCTGLLAADGVGAGPEPEVVALETRTVVGCFASVMSRINARGIAVSPW